MKGFIFFMFLLTASSCCDMMCERERHAAIVIDSVESFKAQNNRLPDDLAEMGIEYNMELSFYNKVDSVEYEVWYGSWVGVSKVYNSKTKSWRESG